MKQVVCKKKESGDIKSRRGSAVKNVRFDAKALYFSDAKGISFRLRFEGVNGWRLQSAKDGKFDSMGASQTLAKYMNEPIATRAQRITVSYDKEKVTLTEKKGTQAILSLCDGFSLRFCTKEGRAVSEVTAFEEKDGQLMMSGALDEKEAIYGGGERLDVTNKRGTRIYLYSCDGWNNSATSYTVVPLFLTTRGGGMFINRYDPAVADFGTKDAGTWTYSTESSVMDCYFYASGSMNDALRGYTELSGHAYMPTPWMQGMHICRYWPDMSTFDQDDKYDALTDIPNWESFYIPVGDGYVSVKEADADALAAAVKFFTKEENGKYVCRRIKNDAGEYYFSGPGTCPGGISVKTLMENLIKADMKPAAASMEPYPWYYAFYEGEKGSKWMKDLSNAAAFLHAHGIKAMVYMAVGTIDTRAVGFKPEYLVHADLTITKPDGTVEVRRDIVDIPWVAGTGENRDAVCRDGEFISFKYLDITNEEACDWYFNTIWGKLIEIGIDGVKIDFCEELANEGQTFGGCKLNYHFKNPEKLADGDIHHAYPVYFISTFYKRMLEHRAAMGLNDGFMVFSRGGGIGSQRSPYMWAGDQVRVFDKLSDQLMATVNSGLSGIPFMSFDMGGYHYIREDYTNTDYALENEIFARAVGFTAFFTQMQTHGDVRHAYEMNEETQQIYRNFTRLHEDLIPYMQKYSKIACETGMPPVRHPALLYPNDECVYSLKDEFFLGEGLLVAPILTKDTYEREVYLPEGSWTELLTGKVLEGGKTVLAKASLGQTPVYLNNNSKDVSELLPVFEGQNWMQIKNWK